MLSAYNEEITNIKMKMKILKILRSKWFDLYPVAAFFAIAAMEGTGFWIGGISLIIWLFALAVRYLVKT